MSFFKYLGQHSLSIEKQSENVHYFTRIILTPEEEATSNIDAGMVYRLYTELEIIKTHNERVVIFEFPFNKDYVRAKIVKHKLSSYNLTNNTYDQTLDELEIILLTFLKANKYTRSVTCKKDLPSNKNITELTIEEGDLNDIMKAKKNKYIDMAVVIAVPATLLYMTHNK